MYSFHRFKLLPAKIQLRQLYNDGIPLDLAYTVKSIEAALFAYNGFYVEMIISRYTQEIVAIKPFKSLKRLYPYLNQIDIGEITFILSHSK